MTAVWTTPKTWNTGDPLTASDMNTHIRDNLEFVKSPPTTYYRVDQIADYTTTSSVNFVAVDGTNLSLTLTTNGGDVLVAFSGSVSNNTLNKLVYLDVEVDSIARVGGDDGLLGVYGAAGNIWNASFCILVRGLSAGSHTFKLDWKVGASSTGTMYAGAGTSLLDMHPTFWVREVS